MNGVYGLLPFIATIFRGTSPQLQIDSNNEIISRLKFISKVKKGEKINVQYLFVQPNNLSTSLSRTFYHKDTRYNTLAFIRNTIDRSFELINFYERSEKQSEKVLRGCIIEDLRYSKEGIGNLKHTYADDIKFCCDLDTILQQIDSILNDLTL